MFGTKRFACGAPIMRKTREPHGSSDGSDGEAADKAARRAEKRARKEAKSKDSAAASSPAPAPPKPWETAIFKLVDKVNSHARGAAEQRLDHLELQGRRHPGAPLEVVDMSEYPRLAEYVRREFMIHESVSFALRPQLPSVTASLIRDDTTLWSFLVRAQPTADPIVLEVVPVAERCVRAQQPQMPPIDLSGAAVLSRDAFDAALKRAIYPSGERHAIGALTPRAMQLLAANPDRLLAFDMLRDVVGRVTGNSRHLLNPVAALCPLHGPNCTLASKPAQEGQIMLHHANDLDMLLAHLRTAHRSEPRAAQLLARLELALKRRSISTTELDELAPFECDPSDRQPDPHRADLLQRSAPPSAELHWVARWLNELLTRPYLDCTPFLSTSHVFVQMIIYLLMLVFPLAASKLMWSSHLPELFFFASGLFYVSKEVRRPHSLAWHAPAPHAHSGARPAAQAGYRLSRGAVYFNFGRNSEVLYRVTAHRALDEHRVEAQVAEHRPWMLRFGEVGTILLCEHDRATRLTIVQRVAAPPEGAALLLRLCLVSGTIASLSPRGGHALVLRRERRVAGANVNVPLPPPQLVQAAELPAVHASGPNLHTIVAFLTIAPTLRPPPPMLCTDDCTVVLVSQKYDERPLKQCGYAQVVLDQHGVPCVHLLGLYERRDGDEDRVLTGERCAELLAAGPAAYRRVLGTASYVQAVEETSTNTLDQGLTLNTHTAYTTSGGKHDAVISQLAQRRRQLGACLNCIMAGEAENCTKPRLGAACSRCTARRASDPRCGTCVYLHSVFDASDAAAEQRKAVGEIDKQRILAPPSLSDADYQQVGIVMLHALKNKVGGMRNYAMIDSTTDGGGEVSIALLRSLVCGADKGLANQVLEACDNDALICRDRHSDALAYQTCSLPVQKALRDAKVIKVQEVPEPYMTWRNTAANHDLLRRPAAVAINVRGDVLVADVENHVVLMYARNVPVKLKVAVGQWGQAGRATNGEGAKVKLRNPTALALLKLSNSKEEICYVVDAGNRAIRLVRNAQSFDATQAVQTVTLGNAGSESFEPYGLAIVTPSLLAISEDRRRRVVIAHLDDTHTTGLVLSTLAWHELHGPRGLASLNGSLFIADVTCVLAVGVASAGEGRLRRAEATELQRNATSRLQTATPFRNASAVAACKAADGRTTLAVADAAAHQVRVMHLRGFARAGEQVFGTGAPGRMPGAIASATFNEPIGLAYSHGVLRVACYGGEHHGAVSAVTPTGFAVRVFEALETAYRAIGYVPPNATLEARAQRHPPVRQAVATLAASGAYLERVSRARNDALGGGRGAEGPAGTWPLYQIESISLTAASVSRTLDDLEAAGVDLGSMRLAGFVNEAAMERSFGQADQHTQYSHPTMQQYADRKPSGLSHAIRQGCTTPHSEHTNRRTQYQAPQRSWLSAAWVISVVRRAWHAVRPRRQELSEAGQAQLDGEVEAATTMAHVARGQRTNNVRASCYKAKCGYAPTILQAAAAETSDSGGALQILTFTAALNAVRDGTAAALQRAPQQTLDASFSRDVFIFLPGDIVFCRAGEVESTLDAPALDATEEWWALQVTRPFERARMRERCQIHGFWLDRVQRSALRWVLLDGREDIILYGCTLKETGGRPVLISSSELESGWNTNNELVYSLPEQLAERLEQLAQRSDDEDEAPDDQHEQPDAGREGEDEDATDAEGEEGDAGPAAGTSAVEDRIRRREEARDAQLAVEAAKRVELAARRGSMQELMQGSTAGRDLAPATRPRRDPRPISRLIEEDGSETRS